MSAARLLIIDDDEAILSLINDSLGADYQFETFMDGSVVIERLAASALRPDVLLTDWVMPNMTGEEVCRYLRSNTSTRTLPIILVTASRVETSDVVAGLKCGADDYVARPFAPEELRARVDAVLRASALRDAATRERGRLDTVNRLGRAFMAAGGNASAILEQLATALTVSLCDGCAIQVLPGPFPAAAIAHHRADPTATELAAIGALADPAIHTFESSDEAREKLPPAYWPYIDRFGMRGLGILPFPATALIQAAVTVTRDGASLPFEAEDIVTIETCIEYASLAVLTAARIDAERVVAEERQAIYLYQQQMLAIVGHDLRNPLSAMSMGIELLEEFGAPIPEVAPVVRKLAASTGRMTRIVDQLLDVTRARLGDGLPMAPRDVELAPLVRASIEELALAYKTTSFELGESVEVTGFWDPDRISQVLANLMSNAVQYGRAGAAVRVSTAISGENVAIAVANTNREGPIPPTLIAVLFDPYKRGLDSKRHTSGLGLGLFIVHEIVVAHAGRIDVESTEEVTTFRVTLPLRRVRLTQLGH